MTLSWYQRQLGVTPQQAPLTPTRFTVVDGKAYPVSDGQEASQAPSTPSWHSAAVSGAPVGQTQVLDGVRLWKGTRDAQTQSGLCPNCHSPSYMPKIRAASVGGGESGKLSLGHCMACSYREDPRGAPSLQDSTQGAFIGQQGVPVVQARSLHSNTDAFGRVSGRFGREDLAGRA